jgi:uncharacterized protein YdeI (YjbR/CyaY-like superfamily)
MSTKQDLPIISFGSQHEWEEWLAENHATSSGLWLKIAKKGSGIQTVSHAEALDVALCYGWIDGQRDKLDADFFLQRFTPRTSRSRWSKINCGKATKLIEHGQMKGAGLREVERARADGRWDAAYEGQSTATVPDDLQRELELNDRARAFFSTLDSRNRYAILYRLQDARNPETRARRLKKFVEMLNEGQKIYP